MFNRYLNIYGRIVILYNFRGLYLVYIFVLEVEIYVDYNLLWIVFFGVVLFGSFGYGVVIKKIL